MHLEVYIFVLCAVRIYMYISVRGVCVRVHVCGRYGMSIYFSRRVPVCPHFAYNQRVRGKGGRKALRAGIAVRLHYGWSVSASRSVLQDVDNRPVAAFIRRNCARR